MTGMVTSMKDIFKKSAEQYLRKLLRQADITVNGDRPWDIHIKNDRFYPRIIVHGSLGLGESYVENWWECEALDQFFFKILSSRMHREVITDVSTFISELKSRLFNFQNSQRAFEVGEHHYDAGNDLFQLMLDEKMVYSCGYWKDADDLDQAQEDKLDLICRKLKLYRGMHLLDIGCGWGSLVAHAARHYGVKATGVTISKEQVKLARQRCSNLPIDIRLQDYREISGQFDAISSVGMFEHVGYKNYPTFINVVESSLKQSGLFLLQTIGTNRPNHTCDPWFNKYIFPNGMLPSISQMSSAIEDKFVMEDWHNLGVDYDRTLMAWYRNFEKGWAKIKANYSSRFFRMWQYYLLSLAGAFRARHLQIWQIVLTSKENVEKYKSVRCSGCLAKANNLLRCFPY